MRGIVELEILKAIERQLPAGIPIRNFFDLMIGTRYVAALSYTKELTTARSVHRFGGSIQQHKTIDGERFPSPRS